MSMQKPFYLKFKLLHQTKINLWDYDESFLKEKLRKKKWDFLKKKLKKKIFFFGNLKRSKKGLDVFSYSPFSQSFFSKRVSNNFKNNLYFRKLIRFKYGRLKNKEFNKIFRKSGNYKLFLKNLGSRLDVNLFNRLSLGSIFNLRQKILYGKILLNGVAVQSPNIQLNMFDVISLRLFDIFNLNYLYKDADGLIKYLDYLTYYLFHLVKFEYLEEEVQIKFISDLSNKLGGEKYSEVFNEFLIEGFKSLSKESVISKEKKMQSFKKLNLEEVILILNKRYIKQRYEKIFNNYKKSLMMLDFVGLAEEDLMFLGFFNNKFSFYNFELKFNGDFIDLVFLGFSDRSSSFGNNEKFLLHYLY